MEAGDKMKELNMSADEMDRLKKAFKDEKFRDMLRDYAQELSDPENKRRYEEEIKLLEQERGNTIEFIHPEPFKALRTSVNGKQKCFINICSSEKVGKPECKWGESEEGRRGQCWSLPHSLHPGRQDTDPKGNKITIYDVIFHPDTLHIAGKNKRFMDMVDSTATQGIQDAFKVTLDKNNMRQIRTKYKGSPQPCVIRKPIPGYKAREPSEELDPLAFPYPDEKRPPMSLQTKPTESPATKNSSDTPTPKSSSIQPQTAKEPTKPNYTVKYRSFVDLQDFRCSRDSAQSPRPKEIVVTIDLPLLKAATDASLEVKEKWLLLESKKPAYRLELPLAYPVDEDKGEAKFNKQRGQLTVTLPVLPSNDAFDFAVGHAQAGVSDDGIQEEKGEEEEQRSGQGDLRQQTEVEQSEEEGESGQEKGEEKMREGVAEEERVGGNETWIKQKREGENNEDDKSGVEEEEEEEEETWKKQKTKGQEGVEEDSEVEVEKLKEQEQDNEKEDGNCNLQKRQQHSTFKDSGVKSLNCDTNDIPAEEDDDSRLVSSPETERQPVVITAEHSSCLGIEGDSWLESAPKMKSSDVKEEPEKTRESAHGKEKVETGAAFLQHISSEESQTSVAADTHSQHIKDCCVPQESSEMPATVEDNMSSSSEELAMGSVKPEERDDVDEDDLPMEQIFHTTEHDNKPPLVLLREVDKDGNVQIISDHSTSAGFTFQNCLMYELD
ncbi:protein kintoun [Epinephelus moara]|uniref:protein kintoun n=1 Tax=Epinephelus moara TaxID=300413 RepID=UPI00214EA3AB|nr:protein kintoun [Epinephelus moara]